MDKKRLVELVKQMPQIWDRNCPPFRDKDAKEQAWNEVAKKMNMAVFSCKEAFKSLREKYLREREKLQNKSQHYQPWELLDDFRFLDPHIVPRAASWNNTQSPVEDDVSINSDLDPTDFDRQLIHMVRKAAPIWDRNCNTYPNKTSKDQLWKNIAFVLHRDANSCMLRWKALREKYIRQKAKYQEGEAKWELLDDLSFLDKVILYRRKASDIINQDSTPSSSHKHSKPHVEDNTSDNNYSYIHCNVDDYSYTDSSSDFLSIVKEETTIQQVADSSYSFPKRTRQNSVSSYGESIQEKRPKFDEKPAESNVSTEKEVVKEKTPEQLFGDLVASLLSKKPENRRNLYMIEIMTVLSK